MSDAARKLKPVNEGPPERGSPQRTVANNRILVVEDEKNIASAYTAILSTKFQNVIPLRRSSRHSDENPVPSVGGDHPEFDVTVTFSAREALEKMQKAVEKDQPFAMAFVDVLLGKGMDGIELTQKLYEMDPELYAVFVTAYSDRSVDSIHSVLGSNKQFRWDYLNKPFSDGEILQKARNAVAWWNLQRERQEQDRLLAEVNRRLMTSERLTSVAAVARGISHEFGNILVQIIGRAELGKDGDEKSKTEALDTILKASETATAILNKFKQLGNPQEAQSHKEKILVQQPLEETLLLLEHQIHKMGVKICWIKNEKVEVYASKPSLVQVFVNLIINALYAMNDHGQLDFTVRAHGDFCETVVRDYGPGIPADLLQKVTEPFFTTKRDAGTGLGLAICKEIVEIEHQGEFIVRNHPMKGAEMIIRLPLGTAAKKGDGNVHL